MRADTAVRRRDLAPFALLRLSTDERLVENVRAGSERAFEVLCDRHYRPLLTFCRHILDSAADAEDAVQQTFLAAYGDLMRSDKPIVLRPWLYTIARHRCLSALRARRERPSDELPDRGGVDVAAEVDAREAVRTTFTDLTRLPDDQRAALVLVELGDVSHEEIARILGCRRDKVKALVFQARTSLTADRTARDTPCADIRAQLADAGGALRHTNLRRHVRACPGCHAFRVELRAGRRGLGLLLPAAWLKRVVPGAVSGSSGAGAGGAALTASAFGGGGLAATVLVVAAVAGGGGDGEASAGADAGEPLRAVATTQPSERAGAVRWARGEPAAVDRPRAVAGDVPDLGGAGADDVAQTREAGDGGVAPKDAGPETASAPAAAAPPSDHAAAAPSDHAVVTEPGAVEGADGDGAEAPPQPRGEEPPGRGRGKPAGSAPANRGQGPAKPPKGPQQPNPSAKAPDAKPPQANGKGEPAAPDKPSKPPATPAPEASAPPPDAGPPESPGPPPGKAGPGNDHGHKGGGGRPGP